MNTIFLDMTGTPPDENAVQRAAALLQKGEVVAIPTETVYGLAANALDPEAVKKIFIAKGRPQDNPLIVHIAEAAELYTVAARVPPEALLLAEKFWPGPLTMILPKKDCIPQEVSAGLSTVAIRCPSHPAANAVIRRAGFPLAAPSANISGFPSPTEVRHVWDDMNGRVAAIADGGQSDVGVESTVITLAVSPPRILRPGGITKEQLAGVLGTVEVDDAVLHPLAAGETAASPGMKYKHYAPRAKITIVRADAQNYHRFLARHPDDFALCFTEDEAFISNPHVTFGSEKDAFSQSHRLFEALRELDAAGAQAAWARNPDPTGVGLAVCNRLYRAAGFCFTEARGITVGITGQTGAGKSTVTARFCERGFTAVDADRISRETTAKGSPVPAALAAAFGADVLREDGTLDRRRVAERAFSSPENTKKLNEITHPAILARMREETAALTLAGKNVVLDAPLLFESGLDALCDCTVAVVAPREVRISRLQKRDGLSAGELEKRMAAQKDEAFFTTACDYVVHNDAFEDIKRDTDPIIDTILNGGLKHERR